MPDRIQLRRTKGWRKPDDAIVVARPGKWGNPFEVWENKGWWAEPYDADNHLIGFGVLVADREAGRRLVVESFRQYLAHGGLVLRAAPTAEQIRAELAGHDLACWCPPSQPCHADVLLEIANVA